MVTRPGSGLLPRRPGRGCPVVESRVAQNAKSLRVTSRSVKTGVAHYVQVMTVSISLFPVSVRFPAWARQYDCVATGDRLGIDDADLSDLEHPESEPASTD